MVGGEVAGGCVSAGENGCSVSSAGSSAQSIFLKKLESPDMLC